MLHDYKWFCEKGIRLATFIENMVLKIITWCKEYFEKGILYVRVKQNKPLYTISIVFNR